MKIAHPEPRRRRALLRRAVGPTRSAGVALSRSGRRNRAAFLNAAVDRKTVSRDRLASPASRYVVQAGAVISAALITGIRSDLPGQVTAQVTENVYDSPSGQFLL